MLSMPFRIKSAYMCVSCFLVWADNADACAKQYAGTGALKTDFTRYVGYAINFLYFDCC